MTTVTTGSGGRKPTRLAPPARVIFVMRITHSARAAVIGTLSALAACSSDINEPSAQPVATVFLAAQSPQIQIGNNTDIVATLKDASGRELTGRSLIWSSSDVAVATVTATGAQTATVTATGAGRVTISAKVEGVFAAVAIVTYPAPATATARSQAFVYSADDGMIAITGISGTTDSWAAGINESGQVVGGMIIDSREHAFIWSRSGGMTDLGILPGAGEPARRR